MDDSAIDQIEEAILVSEVSDEDLEDASGGERLGLTYVTVCSTIAGGCC
jgi:hypothetical protein